MTTILSLSTTQAYFVQDLLSTISCFSA